MQPSRIHMTPWNIFARELEMVLAARGLGLGHLDDRHVVLHPEIVRRLQQSLVAPKHFPVLNPDEIERLFTMMSLTLDEQRRIRAALLATAVERVLMDRLEPYAALMAANDVYEICLSVMRQEPDNGLNAAVKRGAIQGSADLNDDSIFDEALGFIDEATLALHGADASLTEQARLFNARLAASAFTRALAALHDISASDDLHDDWEAYRDMAEEGKALAEALLRNEGK